MDLTIPIGIGAVGLSSIYYYIEKKKKAREIVERTNRHRESLVESVKNYNTGLEKVNTELKLCKRQAELTVALLELRRTQLERSLGYCKIKLEQGPYYPMPPQFEWCRDTHDKQHNMKREMEKELRGIDYKLQGRL